MIAVADPFNIVRLTPSEIALAREMNAMFAHAFEDAESYSSAAPDDAYLRGLLAQLGTIALVAVGSGAVIGGLTAYTLPKFEQARSEVYIYDLAVAADWRRRGVAKALITAVQAIAHGNGAWVVFVQADYGDEPAIALYTKLGIREDVMHFDLLTME